MAFKRNVSNLIRVDVTVNVPNERGTFDKNTFVGFFERPTSPEHMDELRNTTFPDVVRKQLKDWELTDKDSGDKVPFSAEELETVLAIEPTPQAAALAYFEALKGRRVKN
jgi:hypothetical protein